MISINSSPVPHLQIASEWDEFIEKTVVPLRPRRIVEIGSFYGATLWSLINNAPELEKIVSVDLPIPKDDNRYEEMIASRSKWGRWTDKLIDIQGDSHSLDIFQRVKNEIEYIDVLFIDGDHSSIGVRQDWLLYSSLVRHKGIIAFHDHLFYHSVNKLCKELAQDNITYEINHTNDLGIFIIKK